MLAATQPTKRTDPTSGARLASSQAPRGCNHADRRSPANRPPRTERPPGLSGCHCNARKEKSRDANLSQSDLWSGTPGVTPTYPATAAPWPRRWSTLAPPAGLWPAPPLASFALAARTRAAAPAPWTTLPELVQGSHPAEDLPGGGANRQGCTTAGFASAPRPSAPAAGRGRGYSVPAPTSAHLRFRSGRSTTLACAPACERQGPPRCRGMSLGSGPRTVSLAGTPARPDRLCICNWSIHAPSGPPCVRRLAGPASVAPGPV
jgi:hypothetical protein